MKSHGKPPLVSHMKLQNGATQDGKVSNVTCLGNIPYRTDRKMDILITQQAWSTNRNSVCPGSPCTPAEGWKTAPSAHVQLECFTSQWTGKPQVKQGPGPLPLKTKTLLRILEK